MDPTEHINRTPTFRWTRGKDIRYVAAVASIGSFLSVLPS
ncbi:unnamed protein product, partial [Musa acuminata subsp. malaccensis]